MLIKYIPKFMFPIALLFLCIQNNSIALALWQNTYLSCRAVGRSENPGVPEFFGGYVLPPLVQIGLTDLPKPCKFFLSYFWQMQINLFPIKGWGNGEGGNYTHHIGIPPPDLKILHTAWCSRTPIFAYFRIFHD